jgi:inhibitor of cysteine peptidase
MKYIVSALLLLFLPALHAAENAMEITVSASEPKFKVILPSNPTTGYQWTLKQYDKSLVTLVSNQYIPSESGLMGAGGHNVFGFTIVKGAVLPQSTLLTFNYARPWEPNSGSSKTVKVSFIKNK